jgi:hypothetical protein
MKNRATNTTTLNPSNRSGKTDKFQKSPSNVPVRAMDPSNRSGKTDVNNKKVNLASSNNNNESSGPIKGKRIKIKTQGPSNRTRTMDNPRPSNRTRTIDNPRSSNRTRTYERS